MGWIGRVSDSSHRDDIQSSGHSNWLHLSPSAESTVNAHWQKTSSTGACYSVRITLLSNNNEELHTEYSAMVTDRLSFDTSVFRYIAR